MKTNKAENYVTEITGMCSKYSVWEIWCDFINMCAISLANSCDKQQAPQREEVYLQIVKKYNRKELDIFCRLFANLVLDLEENPNQDLLGDIYGKLQWQVKCMASISRHIIYPK